MFWTFRVMVGLGVVMLFVFAAAFWQSTRHQIDEKPWVLKAALYSLPLPWIAIECGWFVAEYGVNHGRSLKCYRHLCQPLALR